MPAREDCSISGGDSNSIQNMPFTFSPFATFFGIIALPHMHAPMTWGLQALLTLVLRPTLLRHGIIVAV